MAAPDPDGVRQGRQPHQRHLPRRAIRPHRTRRGANRATTAVAHSILIACWHMLQTGETYNDPGGDYYQRRDPERATKRLVAQLERLGHNVTLQEAA